MLACDEINSISHRNSAVVVSLSIGHREPGSFAKR